MEFDDAEDWAWCDSQFAAIETYVKHQQLPHGIICDTPEWFTAPYVAFQLDACQFEFPQVQTEDVVSMTVNFVGQEPTATKGDGGEVTIFAAK